MRRVVDICGLLDQGGIELSYGWVTGREDGLFTVVDGAGIIRAAHKADSCLLVPMVDDLVLMATAGDQGAIIISVMVKKSGDSDIALKGRAAIRADSGPLTLSGDKLSLQGADSLDMNAPRIDISGLTGTALFHQFQFKAVHLKALVKKVAVKLNIHDFVAQRVTQRIGNIYRRIDGLEQTMAGRIRHIVRERFSIKSKNASLLAEREIKMNAEKINLG